MEILQIPKLSDLDNAVAEDGQLAYCEETGLFYRYDAQSKTFSENHEEIKVPKGEMKISKRDLMISSIRNMKPMNVASTLTERLGPRLRKYLDDADAYYYLLYGREINYFTLFHRDETADESLVKILTECLNCVGDLLYVEDIEDGAPIIFWMRVHTPDEEPLITELYFFDYTNGVEHFNG